ncbi:MAG: DUF1801 domain-containing protein [Acidobacteria bacterium]|nr:DUF1801 domain-containing protein [Acidobacteriota bacterium]
MAKTVEEYLARVPEPARTTLEKMRAMVKAVAPKEAVECISYGMPAWRYKGMLVGYAAYPKHCTFFVMSGTLLDDFQTELASYETSKGGIRFALDKPLPAGLVKKLVKAKVAGNEAAKGTKKP